MEIFLKDSQLNLPIPSAKAKVSGPDGTVSEYTNDTGKLFLPITTNGVYNLTITSDGFITSNSSIKVSCLPRRCNIQKLIAISPLMEEGMTRIMVTWGNISDLGATVMEMPRTGGPLCRTYWHDRDNCPGITFDTDNSGSGLEGCETFTLHDVDINVHAVYALGVMHYRNDAVGFLDTDATVTVTNGEMTGSQVLSRDKLYPGFTISDPNDWWFVGCLEVHPSGNFSLSTPTLPTFFNGAVDSQWTELAEFHCGGHLIFPEA